MKKLTTEVFIEKAKKVHGDKYNYSKVVYENAHTKVCIICKKHNSEFWQTPRDHLKGRGCPKCGGTQKLTKKVFIERAIEVHGEKYDYSKTIYKLIKTKVCIICKKHGEFWQTPDSHLYGQGCPTCSGSKKLTTREFIKKAKKVHGEKYDYSRVVYKNAHTKVCIICPEHNSEFRQAPYAHLFGQGCPKCGREKANHTNNRKGTLLKGGVKKCSKCQQYRMGDEFTSDSRRKDGLNPQCKSCDSRYKNGPAKFDTYGHQISFAEEVRNNKGLLETKCTKCGKWFTPTNQGAGSRIKALNGKQPGESRLYCSSECKNSCSIFNQKNYHRGLSPNEDRPYKSEWAKAVISKANNECEICGSNKNLVAHHIQPVKTRPHLQADIDNGVCLCTQCHYEKGHSDECSTGKLAALTC